MLYRNDVYRINNVQYRILYINNNEAWVLNIDDTHAFPEQRLYGELVELENSGKLIVLSVPNFGVIQASKNAKVRRDKAWNRIEPLITNPTIFYPEERGRLVAERAKTISCSKVTLYKDLRNYWKGGQVRNALLPTFHLCGHDPKGQTAHRGRPPIHAEYNHYQLDAANIKRIHDTIKKHYLKKDVATMTDAYQRLLEEHYSYSDGNEQRFITDLGERPTLRQFRSVLHSEFSMETIIRNKKSDAEFELNHRAKLGSAQDDCLGVGHIYEIDATIADVFLVHSKDRSRIIGKPTLYLIYDRRSRLVVGFYVGLEAASWPAAMHAILSITEDKSSLCARHGVPYDMVDWPAHGIFPQQFVGDRGELLAYNSSLIVDGLETTVLNLPAKRADWKGTVECGFKLTHSTLAETIPGYEPSRNFHKRQGKHYEKDACLNLSEFTAIILKAIISHNRTPITNYPWPAEKTLQKLQPIPREIWIHESRERMGLLTRYSEEFVRFALLPHDEATVTREGIRFGACYYTCPEAMERGWFVNAGRGVFKVRISYDRRLVDAIYIHDEKDRTKFFIATLLEAKSKTYKGLSFLEVEAIELMHAHLNEEGRQTRLQNRSDFHAVADPISKEALAETRRASKGKSRSARKADTNNDRLDERRIQRQQEARIPPQETRKAFPEPAQLILLKNPVEPLIKESSDALVESLTDRSTQYQVENNQSKQLSLVEKLRQKNMEMLNGK